MRSLLGIFVLTLIACGGSSKTAGSGEGDREGDRGGSQAKGGVSGADQAGRAGTSAGGLGGTGTRGGAGGTSGVGEGGETSGGSAGTTAGTGRGGTEATGGSATGGTGATGAMPSITSCAEEFPFAGEWEGSVLDFYFEPIETVRLVVVPNEELGGYEATLTWGSGDPPPPVTSGEEPYPSLEYWQEVGDLEIRHEPWPGFAYSVVRGAGCDAVFRVSVSSVEPWDEWCSLQTPVYTDDFGWGCTYQGGGSSDSQTCDVQDGRGNVLATYPYWKCLACGAYGFPTGGVCGCDEGGCSFNREPTHVFDLELAMSGEGDILSGPDPSCGDCTVRLERVE
jgi:hypothetical protein